MSDQTSGDDLVALGSETARSGFEIERSIERILNRESSTLRNSILSRLGLSDFCSVSACIVRWQKSDIIPIVNFDSDETRRIGLQVKLVGNASGFNHVAKRYIDKYQELWGFSDVVAQALKKYTGEIPPSSNGRNPKRMFADELSGTEKEAVPDFLSSNSRFISHTIFRSDGEVKPEWFPLVHKIETEPKVYLFDIEKYIRLDAGETIESPAEIAVRRKGKGAGRRSASMPRFKMNSVEITE